MEASPGGGGKLICPQVELSWSAGKGERYKYLGVDQLMAAQLWKVKARVGKENVLRGSVQHEETDHEDSPSEAG